MTSPSWIQDNEGLSVAIVEIERIKCCCLDLVQNHLLLLSKRKLVYNCLLDGVNEI